MALDRTTVTAWRLFHERHLATAFNGEGARRFGGRWNSVGTAVIYCSGTQSLALLEVLVHLTQSQFLGHFLICDVEFDSDHVAALDIAALPDEWRDEPPSPATQAIGDGWITRGESAVLAVPSVLVGDELNYLLNPAHPDFGKIRLGPVW